MGMYVCETEKGRERQREIKDRVLGLLMEPSAAMVGSVENREEASRVLFKGVRFRV